MIYWMSRLIRLEGRLVMDYAVEYDMKPSNVYPVSPTLNALRLLGYSHLRMMRGGKDSRWVREDWRNMRAEWRR